MNFETTVSTPTPALDLSEIPKSQMRGLASATLGFIETFYEDEKNRRGYEAWLKRRENGAEGASG